MKGTKTAVVLAVSAFGLLSQSCSPSEPEVAASNSNLETAAVQQHVDQAFELAGESFMRTAATLQCTVNDLAMTILRGASEPVPMQVFDNLYYVGLSSVASWALQTSDGIILIDALNTTDDAQNVIEPGLRELGAEKVGFSDPSAFTRAFKSWTGLSPKDYRGKFARSRV